MSKKPTAAPPPPTKPGSTGGGAERIDVGDLAEVVTRSVTRALGVQDASRLPIRIIFGFIAEPPDFFRGGGAGGGGGQV
jgi:hypothetical protein